MINTYLTIEGILLLLCGAIIITKKIFFINQSFERIVIMLNFLILPIIISYDDRNLLYFIVIIVMPFLLFGIMITRNKYTIMNVKGYMVESIINNILKENNISYEKKENEILKEITIFLKDYDRYIRYSETMNSVYVDMRNIIKLPIYKELKVELKNRVKQINSTVFPASGVGFIILGIAVLVINKYLV